MPDRGSLFSHCCHSEEPQATWESRRRELHLPLKTEILTSRFTIAPQNDRPSGFVYPNRILRSIAFRSE